MRRQSATDLEIQNWVERCHGFRPTPDWIAHCKQLCGVSGPSVGSRRDWQECPPEHYVPIKQAFRRFGLLPEK